MKESATKVGVLMGEGTALLPGFDQGKWRGLEDEKGQSDNNSSADDAD